MRRAGPCCASTRARASASRAAPTSRAPRARRGGPGGGGGGNRLNILIQGPDIEQLQEYTVQLMDKVRTINGVVDVDSNFEPTQPELRINVDRARAADLGVNIDSLATNLRTLVGGEEVSEFKDGDDQFVVAAPARRAVPQQSARHGRPAGPRRPREDRQGERRGHADHGQRPRLDRPVQPPAPDLGERQHRPRAARRGDRRRAHQGRRAASEARLPGGLRRAARKTLAEASNNFVIAIVLAVAFIYMVLASQFNSFVHPLTIMTALPLSLPAGLLALMAFGMTLNVYSAIGLMMLFGIVKKNSILQVDYTNTLRSRAWNGTRRSSPPTTCRLRPILMTTIAIIAGMLPIAFGRGGRRRLARVDGGHDHRRPGALPAADAARHAGRLFVFRRSARRRGRSRPRSRSIASTASSSARGESPVSPTAAPFRNSGCGPTPTGSVSRQRDAGSEERGGQARAAAKSRWAARSPRLLPSAMATRVIRSTGRVAPRRAPDRSCPPRRPSRSVRPASACSKNRFCSSVSPRMTRSMPRWRALAIASTRGRQRSTNACASRASSSMTVRPSRALAGDRARPFGGLAGGAAQLRDGLASHESCTSSRLMMY